MFPRLVLASHSYYFDTKHRVIDNWLREGCHATTSNRRAVVIHGRTASLGARGSRQGKLPAAVGRLVDADRAVPGPPDRRVAVRLQTGHLALDRPVQPPGSRGAGPAGAGRAPVGVSYAGRRGNN